MAKQKLRIERTSFSGSWLVPLAVVADRLSKAWASAQLPGQPAFRMLPGVLHLTYAENTGAAFSSLRGQTVLLAALTLVLVAAVTGYLLLKPRQPRCLRIGLWLIVAGGLSNLFDRIAYGYVIDFIEFAFVRFAVFNIADVCICLGAALAVLGYARAEATARRGKEREHG